MQALPSVYAGVTFRSRLEARWAIYMDGVGVRWDYEPQGYLLKKGMGYLPDFKVWPRQGPAHFVEIKPVEPLRLEREKAARLSAGTGLDCAIFAGRPGRSKVYLYRNGRLIEERTMKVNQAAVRRAMGYRFD